MTNLNQLLADTEFPPAGTPVDLAVSGGADSLCLLLLARAAGCQVTVHHVDHGLRPESGADAAFVRDLCGSLVVPFQLHRVHVEPGPNLEARARSARYSALPPGVLTGHTADDQAETLLLNLMRGSALSGLSGMRPDRRRPLLRLRRSQTEAACRAAGIEYLVDASNVDARFRRNRVRHELVPLLDEISERDSVAVLARTAAHLAEEDALLEALAADLDPTDATVLRSAPEVLARRSLRRFLRSEAGRHPPDSAAIDRAMAVVRGDVVACEVAAVGRLSRSGGRLRLEPL